MTDFIQKWAGSEGNEQANYQSFLNDFCEFLGVDKPLPKGDKTQNYCFERRVDIVSPSGAITPNRIDFYKEGCFVLETKQGSNKGSKGHGKRGTATYRKEMKKAFGQALKYARFVEPKPPFLITCDIGDHFRIWQDFSESWLSANGNYGTYDSVPKILFKDLEKPEIKEFFVKVFTDPQSLNPEKIAAKVTREVAADLAELAKTLEQVAKPQDVAQFLMRCIFTMFAEDVGLLPTKMFTENLKETWIPEPSTFKEDVEELWDVMNKGGKFWKHRNILRFNGGLFANPKAFALTKDQLKFLLTAAERDWKNVEPAIFGTLLERALEKKERSKLGAHYTPRAYVERLVRPVIIEPLQEKWQLIQGEVETLLEEEETAKSKSAKTIKRNEAAQILRDFLGELRQIRVLDPACGSGNFLYVTMDLMKTLELEVLNRLGTVTGASQLSLDFDQINPSQFLGIEINPRAAEIADLVIWIGYLQWHFRLFGSLPPVEPVLREFKNIENRDAVLEYDGTKPAIAPKTGKVRTRWGGRTMKHPVTGEDVPDPSDQVEILDYINPRQAQWQKADYIVSNPPFLGKINMRESLGDGYVEILRKINKDLPDAIDFVMYWWNHAAILLSTKKIERFGFISTNSITQTYNRRIIDFHITKKKKNLNLFFAIPDHPWLDSKSGAAIRIAMTGVDQDSRFGALSEVKNEYIDQEGNNAIFVQTKLGLITPSLTIGLDLASTRLLKSNENLACVGYQLTGKGFVIDQEKKEILISNSNFKDQVIFPLLSGRDITQSNRNLYTIDLFGWTLDDAANKIPNILQYVIEHVKPEREQNNNLSLRQKWWLFEKNRSTFRPALKQLRRFIVTSLTAKHRFFIFCDSQTIADSTTVMFAFDDAFYLAILSSQNHMMWALASGGTLEDRPRYNKTICFDPFPFPDPSEELKQEIRELGERLDSHRKQVQAAHPEVTITAMYNCLEKMRSGEPFTDADREFNNKALISTLKQIHDDLDQAVFRAYGWDDLIPLWQQVYRDPPQPPFQKGREENFQKVPLASLSKGGAEGGGIGDLGGSSRDLGGSDLKEQLEQSILQRLVDLNAERAEEERNGLIRWLRPEYQAPDQISTQKVIEGIDIEEEKEIITPTEQQKFPTKLKDQLAVIRNLLRTQGGEWTEAQIIAQFKGKTKTGTIQNCLEILEDLGVIFSHTEAETTRYYAAEFQNIT